MLRVSFALILAFMILLFFSSARLQSWVNGFDVGPVQDRVVLWAGTWNRTMDELGFAQPADVIRKHMAALREASWDDVRTLSSDKLREETAIPQHMRGTLAGREG